MKPIPRILLILLLAFILCEVSFKFMEKGLLKYNNHSTVRLTEILEKNTYYDIVFIGSSRTHTTINPKFIDSICEVSSYNAGIDGGNLFEFKMTYEAFLQNHPSPKLLVLTLDLSSFNLQRKFFNYTQYFPFLNNEIIDSALSNNGHNTRLQKIFPFLGITDFDDYSRGNAIKGLISKGQTQIAEGEFQYKGYLSNTQKFISPKDTPTTVTAIEVDQNAVKDLEDILKICERNNTELIFTYAPEYNFELQKHTSNSKEILEMISEIANKNNIEYLRHDSLEICQNLKLFANVGHVNTKGSEEYSKILAKKLLMEIKNISPAGISKGASIKR